jgi:hypothetical protein
VRGASAALIVAALIVAAPHKFPRRRARWRTPHRQPRRDASVCARRAAASRSARLGTRGSACQCATSTRDRISTWASAAGRSRRRAATT